MFFLPPHPKVGCPIILEIENPWGKVMERNKKNTNKGSKIAVQKKFFFNEFRLKKSLIVKSIRSRF